MTAGVDVEVEGAFGDACVGNGLDVGVFEEGERFFEAEEDAGGEEIQVAVLGAAVGFDVEGGFAFTLGLGDGGFEDCWVRFFDSEAEGFEGGDEEFLEGGF